MVPAHQLEQGTVKLPLDPRTRTLHEASIGRSFVKPHADDVGFLAILPDKLQNCVDHGSSCSASGDGTPRSSSVSYPVTKTAILFSRNLPSVMLWRSFPSQWRTKGTSVTLVSEVAISSLFFTERGEHRSGTGSARRCCCQERWQPLRMTR